MRDLSVHGLTPDGRCIRVADADSQTSGMLPGVTLELKKGAVYLLTFWDYTETDEELELCVRHHAELIGNYLPDLPEEQEHIRLFAGETVPSLVWTQEMKEGTDYTVQYFGEGSSGLLAAVVRGTGAYCGTAYVTYAQTGQLPQSGTVPVNLAQNDFAEFQFIPETGGTYRFYTDYSGDEIRAVLDKNVFDPERFDPYRYYSLKTEMQICDANGEEIASVSESPVQPAAMTAVLKAGQTYFVTVRMTTMNATESFVLGVEHERCPLAETKVYFEETVYAGDAEQPAPRLWNDTEQLKEGIDYTVAAPESAEPGYRMFLISGCGKYCGHCYCFSEVLDGFSKPQKLELNAPFTQKYAEVTYTFALDQPVTLRLRPDDGAKENYTAQLIRKLEPTVRNLDMNRQTVDLVPDSYTLTLWQQSGAERSYVLETMRRQTDISACEIVTQNAVCTGQPVTPDVKVSDNGVLLTEGSDYFVSCQQTLRETGQYILHITGNGRYCGTASVSMCILPADLTALPLLTDGEYTAKIEKPAQTVLYRWSPGTNGCISTDANMDKQFSVSQNGTVLAQTGGIGFDMLTPDTEADAVYVVAVSLRNPDETGTVRFTVQSGFRELSLCHADIPAQLPADSAGGLPAFTVKDGDTVLKEGTDYTVYASGGQDRCGRAQIILRGTGKYTGELVLEYLRYPEDPAKFALAENADDGEYEIEQLVTEEPVRLIYSLPGTVSLFRFRAADDGTYYFMLPEQNASAFVYLPDGSVLPAGQNAAALSAGVECLILTVSDWVEPGFNRYDTFEVGVSRTAPVGDVNGDGRTDTDDALALLRWLSESEDAALQNPDAADCNADGFIDMLDVQTILRISKES